MGLRFRQRIKVFPGVHVNVSLGGMSVSMGGPGATVNIGKNLRVRGTVGLPGSGLSYQGTMHPGVRQTGSAQPTASSYEESQAQGWTDEPMEGTEPFEELSAPFMGAPWTPEELMPVQNLIIEAHQERQALDTELEQLQQRVASAHTELARVDTWWRRWLFKKSIDSARTDLEQAQAAREHVQRLQEQQGIPIHWAVEDGLQQRFAQFTKDMRSMLNRAQGWHLLGMNYALGDNRAWVSSPQMQRTSCTVGFGQPAFFTATDDPLYQNTPCITCGDGLALYFYPTFILVQRPDAFGLLPPQALCIEVDDLRVAEHDPAYGSVPSDEYTWHYVNKNGAPDQRYTYNPRVPLLDYQRVTLRATQGLHETFLFTGGAYALASWLGVVDWYEALDKHRALQALPVVQLPWTVRSEPGAAYFMALHEDTEWMGFGLPRHADEFWVCLNAKPSGVVFDQDCTFYFWLDGQPLELGAIPDNTRRVVPHAAAFRVTGHPEGQDRAVLQQLLGSAKEAMVLVESKGVPTVRLRLALADPAPFWDAIQQPAPAPVGAP